MPQPAEPPAFGQRPWWNCLMALALFALALTIRAHEPELTRQDGHAFISGVFETVAIAFWFAVPTMAYGLVVRKTRAQLSWNCVIIGLGLVLHAIALCLLRVR